MSDDDKLDFAAIDPSRDPKRWERMIALTTQRAVEARAATSSLPGTLSRLSWPLTAAAALVTAAALVLMSLSTTGTGANQLTPESMSEWANAGAVPPGVDLVALTEESR